MEYKLPEKGEKRVSAILALGNDAQNGDFLFQLATTEKGKCKTAALKALAQLEYPPANLLWKKLVKGKYMGEGIFSSACSDCVSESIAPYIKEFFTLIFELPENQNITPKQDEQIRFCISVMLGKASEKMVELYQFLAENNMRFMQLKKEDMTFWNFNDSLQVWDAEPKELEKVFPLVLTAAMIKNQDTRLFQLADRLYTQYGGPWLIPFFMKSILTEDPEKVYDDFSKYVMDEKTATYIYNCLGLIYYQDYPKDYKYERATPVGYYALVFWGNYSYGSYDTRFNISAPVSLDTRWILLLIKDSESDKPKVTYQSYNRREGGVLFEGYDEMLLGLLPEEIEDTALKEKIYSYFKTRSQKIKVEDSITVYSSPLRRYR